MDRIESLQSCWLIIKQESMDSNPSGNAGLV
jgi:hypothetical protein